MLEAGKTAPPHEAASESQQGADPSPADGGAEDSNTTGVRSAHATGVAVTAAPLSAGVSGPGVRPTDVCLVSGYAGGYVGEQASLPEISRAGLSLSLSLSLWIQPRSNALHNDNVHGKRDILDVH